MLRELVTARSAEARQFRRYIRLYNSALSMISIRADFPERGPGDSKFFPTVTLHGWLYHEMGALIPPLCKKPLYAAVYTHDTDRTAM